MKTLIVSVITGSVALALGACSSPTRPSDVATIPAGTHQSAITAVTGPGAGGVSVTPKVIESGTFAADISISLVNAMANTTYFVQRAPEVGRALGSDGICQRATGQAPWSAADPPAPAFIAFQLPNAGPSVWLTTSPTGAGSVTFEFFAPTIPAGTLFDVMFRLVNNESAPTAELRSGCFTVLVK